MNKLIYKFPIFIQLLLSGLISMVVYIPLLNGYFIQDEWQLFSILIPLTDKPIFEVLYSFIIPSPGQYVPITTIFSYVGFLVFKLNYYGYLLVGLLLHLISGILIGLLIFKLTKKRYLAFIGELFFIITPNHFQATSWIIANIGYSLSAIFFIFGLIYFFDWLNSKKNKDAIITSAFLFISLLCKEITIFSFLALPLVCYIWTRSLSRSVKSLFIVLPAFLFAVWHYLFLKLHPLPDLTVENTIKIQNILLLPPRGLVQSIIPQDIIYNISDLFLSFLSGPFNFQKHTFEYDRLVEGKGAGGVIVLLTALIIIFGVYLYKISKQTKKNITFFNLYIIGVILSALSGLPYIFVDTFNFSLLQPRYSYIGVACISLALCSSIFLSYEKFKSKLIFGLVTSVFLLFAYSTFSLSLNLGEIGELRKNILDSVEKSIPDRSEKIIIYIESDSSFYGLPADTHILPFQNGLGKTLGIYLNDKVYLPRVFYKADTLWPITSQGYYQDNKGYFGYYREYNDLVKSVKENEIDKGNIYSFSYKSRTSILLDKTQEIRNSLEF